MSLINDNLRDAAETGNEAELKALLLLPECDAMSGNKYGRTALMWASEYGHPACVQFLLPVSDALIQDDYGRTALMWASHYGHTACAQLLLPFSDALARDSQGKTASDHARVQGHVPLADFIDAYILAMHEMATIRSATAPGMPPQTSTLRV